MGMKCYYEILNVSQDATDDDLKKSYRKLALRWHPDKNLEHVEEAKEKFQLVQQAYEVLSDPQERAWYDRHRDSILKGGLGKDYNDESLNLYPYFTTACFKGYGDDEKGFYSVYREVFNQLSAEDSEYNSDLDSDEEIPDFGDSKSSYEDKVHSFYSYWQSYATKKSFSWLDEYDTRTAPNRRVAKLMEKENKKIRDGARKERNEEIRTLVAFVRKRDKRVLEYAKVLEERAALNADKVIQQKLKQKQQRQEEIRQQIETQSEWSKFSNLEKELKEIEENLAAEFNDHLSEECTTDEEDTESNQLGSLYCSACNKLFKTEQAFVNHEKSKKHRENVEEMSFNDPSLESPEEEGKTTPDDVSSVHSDNISVSSQLLDSPPPSPSINSKKNKKKRKNKQLHTVVSDSDAENNDTLTNLQNDSDSEFDTKRGKSKRNRKKANAEGEKPTVEETPSNETANDCGEIADKSESKKSKGKKDKVKKEKTAPTDGQQALPRSADQKPSKIEPVDIPKDHTCKACTVSFKSNNELFKHLKKTGHALPPSGEVTASSARLQTKTRRKK